MATAPIVRAPAPAPAPVAAPGTGPGSAPAARAPLAATATSPNATAQQSVWSAPAPQAVPYVPQTNVWAQLGEALAQGPTLAAEQRAKMAQANAAATEAPLEAQTQALAADDAMLQRLAPILSGPNAEAALQNPAIRAVLEPILKRRGIAWTGDLAQIQQIVSPIKPWAQWTPEEKIAAGKLPKDQRGLPWDAPQSAKDAAPVIPLTPTAEGQLYKTVTDQFARLQDGKGTGGDLLTSVLAARAAAAAGGAPTAQYDQFLDSTGTKLNSNITQQLASDYAEAKIKQIEALTGVAVDREKVYQRLTDRRIKELDATDARGLAKLKIDQEKVDLQGRALAIRAQTAQSNLSARWASIENTETFRTWQERQALTRGQQGWLKTQYGAIKGEYDKALTQYETNKRAIANGADEDDLLDSQTMLQGTMDTLGPQLEQMQKDITGFPASNLAGMTGNHVSPAPTSGPAKPSSATSTEPHGAAWFKAQPAGTQTVGSDGHLYTKLASGKWRRE